MSPAGPGIGARGAWFWGGCGAIVLGVGLHLPMLAAAHAMGNRAAGMPMADTMLWGMALIAAGVLAAFYGVLPPHTLRMAPQDGRVWEAPDETPLGRWHWALLGVMVLGLIIDTMKPATLGFVLPGLRAEYGISKSAAALLPFAALTGTALGSLVWGWLADIHGRRVSIMLSTILFVATSICGAMPSFGWNLAMCFLMGCSAGGMLPVVYTLLTEIMPSRHRSWVLVLVGGLGLVGGYLAAGATAYLFEPGYGWRSLWLQGFPTGIALLVLARFIPESPQFLRGAGRERELAMLTHRYGIVARAPEPSREPAAATSPRLTGALVVTALAWSFVNFGLLLWLPFDLRERGFSAGLASGILTQSALLALPTIVLAAIAYSRWSSKWTLVAAIGLTLAGLVGAALPAVVPASSTVLVGIIALLLIGTNATIAVLLPYAAENYPLRVRGRATGTIAASSKLGGIAVQGLALMGIVPTLGAAAGAPILPLVGAALLVAAAGRETRGVSLRRLET